MTLSWTLHYLTPLATGGVKMTNKQMDLRISSLLFGVRSSNEMDFNESSCAHDPAVVCP
jgi:hypothetical protein